MASRDSRRLRRQGRMLWRWPPRPFAGDGSYLRERVPAYGSAGKSIRLASYRAAGLSNLILCIDEERDCANGDLPAGALVLRFRRRVDAGALVRLIESPGYPASIDTCLTGN